MLELILLPMYTVLQLTKCLGRSSAAYNLDFICQCQCFNISLSNMLTAFDSPAQMEAIDPV